MFYFVPISFCLFCMAAPFGIAVGPVPAASVLTACRTWIGFDAPWETPNAQAPHRYREVHLPAQRV